MNILINRFRPLFIFALLAFIHFSPSVATPANSKKNQISCLGDSDSETLKKINETLVALECHASGSISNCKNSLSAADLMTHSGLVGMALINSNIKQALETVCEPGANFITPQKLFEKNLYAAGICWKDPNAVKKSMTKMLDDIKASMEKAHLKQQWVVERNLTPELKKDIISELNQIEKITDWHKKERSLLELGKRNASALAYTDEARKYLLQSVELAKFKKEVAVVKNSLPQSAEDILKAVSHIEVPANFERGIALEFAKSAGQFRGVLMNSAGVEFGSIFRGAAQRYGLRSLAVRALLLTASAPVMAADLLVSSEGTNACDSTMAGPYKPIYDEDCKLLRAQIDENTIDFLKTHNDKDILFELKTDKYLCEALKNYHEATNSSKWMGECSNPTIEGLKSAGQFKMRERTGSFKKNYVFDTNSKGEITDAHLSYLKSEGSDKYHFHYNSDGEIESVKIEDTNLKRKEREVSENLVGTLKNELNAAAYSATQIQNCCSPSSMKQNVLCAKYEIILISNAGAKSNQTTK